MKKKLLALLTFACIACLSAVLLTGCSSSNEEAESSEDTSAEISTLIVGFDNSYPPYGFMDENNEPAIKLTAEIYSAEGRKEDAVEMFDKMIHLNPYNSEAYSGKARILTEEGKAEAAKDVLDEAIDINPAEADLYKARAEAKSKLGDEKGSEEDMAKCKELSDAEKEKANDLTDKEKKTEFDNIIGIFK